MQAANFIDGGYLNAQRGACTEVQGLRLRYDRLAAFMGGSKEVLRTYFYHCPPFRAADPTEAGLRQIAGAERFFQALRGFDGFEVRLGKLACRGQAENGSQIVEQKRVDTMLAVDMMRLAFGGFVQEMNLLSGDCDFLPVVEAVKDLGVRVRLFHGQKNSYSQELYWACDERVELTPALLTSISVPKVEKLAI